MFKYSFLLLSVFLLLSCGEKDKPNDDPSGELIYKGTSGIDTSGAIINFYISGEINNVTTYLLLKKEGDDLYDTVDSRISDNSEYFSFGLNNLLKREKYYVKGVAVSGSEAYECDAGSIITLPFLFDSIYPMYGKPGDYIYMYGKGFDIEASTKLFLKYKEDSVELEQTGGASNMLFYYIPETIDEINFERSIVYSNIVISDKYYYNYYEPSFRYYSLKPHIDTIEYNVYEENTMYIYGQFGPLNFSDLTIRVDTNEALSSFGMSHSKSVYYHQVSELEIATHYYDPGTHTVYITLNGYTVSKEFEL